jgi:hypothetical protein
MKSFRAQVCALGQEYLNCNPGLDSESPNTGLHGRIRCLLEGDSRNKLNDNTVVKIFLQLQYRMEVMDRADEYLVTMDVKPTNGLTCREYNHEIFKI